jgi:tetratricopeptide (TPR) repeat protein
VRVRARNLAWSAAFGIATLLVSAGPGTAHGAQRNPPSPAAGETVELIRQLLAENRTAEGLEAAGRFAREHRGDPDALLRLAGLLASRGQHARAAALFARVNELRPHSPDVLYNLGVAYYQLQQPDQAATALAESADLDGRSAETHWALALIAMERGDHENAILELHHALERAPHRASYYVLLGQEFFQVGYWQGAAEAYRHAAAIEARQPSHYLHLGDALFRARDLAGAIAAFREAARLAPGLPEINYLIALAYRNNGQLAQARQYYQRQLARVPHHFPSLLGAGTIAVDQQRFAEAERLLQLALTVDSGDAEANFEWGLLWFKQHQYERAGEAFKRALWLRPDHTQAEYYLYLALARTHQEKAAAAALAAWKKLEALDRKVRGQEVAYDSARSARWERAAAAGLRAPASDFGAVAAHGARSLPGEAQR